MKKNKIKNKTRKQIEPSKIYLLVESNEAYKPNNQQICGKIIAVAVSNDKPCMFYEKKQIIVDGGKLIKYEKKKANKNTNN